MKKVAKLLLASLIVLSASSIFAQHVQNSQNMLWEPAPQYENPITSYVQETFSVLSPSCSYCYVAAIFTPQGPYKFLCDTFQNLSVQGSDFFAGASWIPGDTGRWYACTYSSHNLLYCDTVTGTNTIVGNMPSTSGSYVGLAYDPVSDTLFLLTTSPSNLYWVNKSTGQATLRAPITGIPSNLIIDGAFSNGGQLYGIELTGAGHLGKINKYTGVWTNVGLLGVIPYYAQGCAFDRIANTFYWASYTQTGPGILRRIDTNTATTTIIGTFPGGAEIDGFAIPNSVIIVGANNQNSELPKLFSLSQNYPNPFNPLTVINYKIPKASEVKLVVYDILGKEVRILVNEMKQPGSYDVEFDASSLASGLYIYKIQAGDPVSSTGQVFTDTKKMLLIK